MRHKGYEKRDKDKKAQKAQKGKRGCKQRGMGPKYRATMPNRNAAKFCILRCAIMLTN